MTSGSFEPPSEDELQAVREIATAAEVISAAAFFKIEVRFTKMAFR